MNGRGSTTPGVVALASLVAAVAGGVVAIAADTSWTTILLVAATCGAGTLTGALAVRRAGRARGADLEHLGRVRLSAVVEHTHDVVMLLDRYGSIQWASPAFGVVLGHPAGSWRGRSLAEMAADAEQRAAVEELLDAVVTGGSATTLTERVVLVGGDERPRHAEIVLTNRLGDRAVDGVVATVRGVTDQPDVNRRLSHRAFHDELTGLANRALFLDRMDHALRINRHGSDPVMVLFIDLDDFKEVNDRHGHGVGDEMLRAIAQRVRAAIGSGDTAARLGGDEFAVLLEDTGGVDRALELAERLLESLREPVVIGTVEVVVLASIGIAAAPVGASTTSLLREADLAMYEAKRAGKGQIRIFDPAMRRVAARHAAYRHELARAVDQGQLRVVFLPYVDLRSGEVLGAEALVRWHHPEHGEIPPDEFIPIAVRTGLIVPIGRWVIGEALDQAVGWRSDVDLFVSVNLTAVELRQNDLIDHLIATVRARRLPPRTLMLEVTETDLMSGGDRALETVAELRRHGFAVALDDFGAGYCSISHLQRHPVDTIKIDRVFVGELDRLGGDPTMVRAVLGLTDTLGVRSAAEGIETPEQLVELRRLGCRMGQGHLLSAALEAPVIARRFGSADSDPVTLRG